MPDITFNGITMEFDVVERMMDAEIKSKVMEALGNCSEQELIDAYLKAHRDRYGASFLQSD